MLIIAKAVEEDEKRKGRGWEDNRGILLGGLEDEEERGGEKWMEKQEEN